MWKKIKSTNNRYEANKLGQIRMCVTNVRNNINGGTRKVGGKVLSPKTKSNGYKEVNLSISPGVTKSFYVHRLVAECFIGDIPKGLSVNHINGDKSDNNVKNLEIVTYSQNMIHAYLNGLNKPPVVLGSNNYNSKITEKDVLEIRSLSGKMYQKDIGKKFGIAQNTVSSIIRRETWKHV